MRAFGLQIMLWAATGSLAWGGTLERAHRLYDRTEYASAVAELQGAQDAPSLVLTGQSYVMLGDPKRATEVLERAVAADPESSNAHLWLGRAYGRRAETAFALAAPGYASKARANFEKAVSLNPRNTEAVNDLFEYYLEAPGFLGGGIEKASRLAETISKTDPAEGSFAEARIAEHHKQFASAEAHLRRAAQLSPLQVGRLLDLARFLGKQGRYEESDRTFEQAQRVAPNAPKVFYSRAHSLIETHRNLPEARELLKKYLACNLSPDDPSRQDAEKLLRQTSGS